MLQFYDTSSTIYIIVYSYILRYFTKHKRNIDIIYHRTSVNHSVNMCCGLTKYYFLRIIYNYQT